MKAERSGESTTKSNAAANRMLDAAPIGAYWTRKDGTFAWVNQYACDMLGYTREQLLALDIYAVDADVTPEFWASYWDEVDSRKISRLERSHRRSDGSLVPLEITVRLTTYSGESVHFAFARDLTEQKRAEKLQRDREQYMAALFNDSPMPQLIIDPGDMRIVDNNSAADTFYGFDELRGRGISSINTLSPEEIRQEMQAAATRERHFFRFRHRLASGNIRDVHVYSGPIQHNDRSLLHSSIEDMTPLYAFQHELEGYRDQLERLPIGVYRTTPGPSGVIVSVNQAMCEILDVDAKADLIGRPASDFHPDASARAELSDLILEVGEVRKIERELVTAKGRRIFTLLSLRAIDDAGGDVFFEGSIQDITGRKRAEQQREAAFQRLHAAIHAAPIPIMLHHADGTIEEIN